MNFTFAKNQLKWSLLPALFFLLSCTTIDITEQDAFDNHRTVTPESFRSDVFTLTETEISTSDGETLNAWWFTRDDAEATVLYFGGNGFLLVKARPWIRHFEQVPVNVLMFDYRGYGLSSGSPSVDGLIDDSRSAFQFLTETQGISGESIVLHGHSMGSFMAGRLANETNAAGYILESPISNVRDWTRRLVPWLLRPFIRFSVDDAIGSQNNVTNVETTQIPLFIVTGGDDQVTPKVMAEKLYEASASPKKTLKIVRGGGHNDLPESQEYTRAYKEFLQSLFPDLNP
ncbi:MAG: alpha/beta hydrolase [Balneolia bacterium]|nr:alpha/beta hydrolase [Balneolia bacterium]